MKREERKEASLSQERTIEMKQSSVADYLNMEIFQYVFSMILLIAAISTLLSEFFMSLAWSSSIAAMIRSACKKVHICSYRFLAQL